MPHRKLGLDKLPFIDYLESQPIPTALLSGEGLKSETGRSSARWRTQPEREEALTPVWKNSRWTEEDTIDLVHHSDVWDELEALYETAGERGGPRRNLRWMHLQRRERLLKATLPEGGLFVVLSMIDLHDTPLPSSLGQSISFAAHTAVPPALGSKGVGTAITPRPEAGIWRRAESNELTTILEPEGNEEEEAEKTEVESVEKKGEAEPEDVPSISSLPPRQLVAPSSPRSDDDGFKQVLASTSMGQTSALDLSSFPILS